VQPLVLLFARLLFVLAFSKGKHKGNKVSAYEQKAKKTAFDSSFSFGQTKGSKGKKIFRPFKSEKVVRLRNYENGNNMKTFSSNYF
jgi:hypothetical protein